MASKLSERKRRLAAKIIRNVKPSSDGKIGAAAGSLDRVKVERFAGMDFEGFP